MKRSAAVAAALVLTGWAGLAPAVADPGSAGGSKSGAGQAASGKAGAQDKSAADEAKAKKGKGSQGKGQGAANQAKPNPPKPAAPAKGGDEGKPATAPGGGKPSNPGSNGNGPKPGAGADNSNAGGNGGAQGPKAGQGSDNGDPAGNNGTVKIEQLGAADGTPNNVPHPGCQFQIEWYGFDEGDYWSTVTFTPQAPTSDAVISGTEPATVFVGEDPATGAGTDTGLDAVQGYTLGFTGTPHPKQGYHVKLTVATPFSQGNDTKSKVFWVGPCDSDTPTGELPGGETPDGETPDGETPEGELPGVDTDENTTDEGVLGTDLSAPGADGTVTTTGEVLAGVLGIQASAGAAGAAADAEAAAVPTSVDAGEGNPVLDMATSPVPLAVLGLGLALGAYTLLRRRQGA